MRGVINLTVHGIGPTDRALDPGEETTWVDEGRFERMVEAVRGRPDVHITFDDGNASDVEIALPLLQRHGLTAEFFVLAGRLGEPGRLTEDQVGELVAAGMGIGSHGWAHCDWRQLDEPRAHEEIVTSRERLADLIGRPVTNVAIPFGSYDRHVLKMLRDMGVARAYTSDGGPARRGAWLQARNSLRYDMDEAWIQQVLEGDASIVTRSRRIAARGVKRIRG